MIAILITVITGIPLGNALSLEVFQPFYVVASQGQATLPCTYKYNIQPKEMRVSLFKGMYGKEMICSAYVNASDSQIVAEGEMLCRGNVSTGKVDMTVYGLRGEHTDIYRCQVSVIFPPPYLRETGNGTLVYVPEIPDCPPEHTQARIQDNPEVTPTQNPSLPLILICAVLITTTIILILQVMNMILTPPKYNHMSHVVPQKGNYSNFW